MTELQPLFFFSFVFPVTDRRPVDRGNKEPKIYAGLRSSTAKLCALKSKKKCGGVGLRSTLAALALWCVLYCLYCTVQYVRVSSSILFAQHHRSLPLLPDLQLDSRPDSIRSIAPCALCT